MSKQFKPASSIHELVDDMLRYGTFWADHRCPIGAHLEIGDERALFVGGDNATGKSLFVEYLRTWAQHGHDFSQMCVSIRERTGSGLSDMAGMRRSMMFGNESEQSTGATSLSTTLRAFTSIAGWVEKAPTKRILAVLDEPDTGLSPAYSEAMGTLLARKLNELDSPLVHLVIVTHNRKMAQAFAQERGLSPTFVHMDSPMSFENWLSHEPRRSVDELLALDEIGHQKRKAISEFERTVNEELQVQEKASSRPKARKPKP